MKGLLASAMFLCSTHAAAGGYDTPMLYSARHIGQGGTAIGSVNDPSALFHNPAGLAHVPHVAGLVDFSLLLGKLHASPSITERNVESDTTVAPFFLVGGAFRINRWLSAGLGLYPIASSGATYSSANGMEDTTRLLFVEATPALAVSLPGNVRLGAGYRVTFVHLERYQGNPSDPGTPFLDFRLSGYNFTGFRAGVQWTPTPELELGAAYRHRTITPVKNDLGVALRQSFRDVSTEFVLPTKLGVGARYDLSPLGPHLSVSADLEYTLNSQNEGSPLRGTPLGETSEVAVPNVFAWKNTVTLRLGAEYRLLRDAESKRDKLALRAGYIFDSQTANRQYPTAFGTPPAATQVLTTGAGYDFGLFQSNVALAYRFGGTNITTDDLSATGHKDCAFCGSSGDYRIRLVGLYADAGYSF